MNFIKQVAPWLLWVVVFAALTVAGTRTPTNGTTTTNPRSLDQPAAVAPCHAPDLAHNC